MNVRFEDQPSLIPFDRPSFRYFPPVSDFQIDAVLSNFQLWFNRKCIRAPFWKQGMTKKVQGNAEATIIPFNRVRCRIQPPSDLTIEELCIFKDVVRRHAPTHFAESDKPLLSVYC